MPFGKNKRLAPRAKKKGKVQAREETLNAAKEKACIEEEPGDGAAVEPSFSAS